MTAPLTVDVPGRHRLRRPDVEVTVTVHPWAPTTTIQIPAALECAGCGRQMADTLGTGHDGRTLYQAGDLLYGSYGCVPTEHVERVECPPLSPVPPPGLIDAIRVPQVVSAEVDPAAALVQLAYAAAVLLAADDQGASSGPAWDAQKAALRRTIAATTGGAA